MSSFDNKPVLEQQSQPLVWIVVLHYSDPQCTKECLQSLRQTDYPNFKVLLLDNGSPDKSGDVVAPDFPQFEYQRLSENLGFAGGHNYGVRYCVERGAQWVWMLNNDTKVPSDCLSQLMVHATQESKAAALSALVYTPHKDGFVPSGMGEIDFLRGKTLMRRVPPADQDTVDCEWLSGSDLLVRTEAFLKVNGFNEDYFLYFEDTDLCYRFRQAGWQCLLVPKARVDHIGGASTEGKLNIWRSYYYTRNRFLFFLTHTKGAKALPLLLAIGAHLLRHSLVLPWRGERGQRQLKAELLGLRDYVSGNLGKAKCLDW